jgi:hemerythrin
MAILTWSDKFSVGVQSIDDQHAVLFDALNALHSAMTKGHGRIMAGELLRDLVIHTGSHFAAEEALLDSAKYPGLAEHHQKHRILMRQMGGYIERFERGEITLNLHLLNFLRDWLTIHIQTEDRACGAWLQEHSE